MAAHPPQRSRRPEDFAIGFRHPVLLEFPDDIDGDMIAARNVIVEKQPVQIGLTLHLDPALLHQFAVQAPQKLLPTSTPPPGNCQPVI